MDDDELYRRRKSVDENSRSHTGRRKKHKRRKNKPQDESEIVYDNPAYNGHVQKSSRSDYASVSNVEVVRRSPTREAEPHMSMTARSLNAGTIKEVEIEHVPEQQGLPSVLKKHIIDDHVKDFVTRNIRHKECELYVRDNKKNTGACQCGREYAWHDGRVPMAEPHIHKWVAAKHTKTIPADTFGTIHFSGFGTENTRYAPYIRIENNIATENMENVWALISQFWHVPPPRLIISVTGGAKRFHLKNRLKQSFKRGLVSAATSTGAWVVTGGSNAGVMEFVGEAVKEYMMTQGVVEQQLVALGIATWGIVDNKDALVDPEGEGLFPAVYDIDELSSKTKRGVSPLDPNHSHFILVDDGSETQFGKEIEFRANFEQYLSLKMKMVNKNKSVEVPVVSLVLEGGENTLNTAKSAIESGTPVVVVNGSGRAADFIAKAYKETKQRDDDTTEFPTDFDEKFKGYAGYMFDWSREKDPKLKEDKIMEAVRNVKSLLEFRHMVTVFSMDEDDTNNEVDQAILDALLKAKKSDVHTQLNLALAWNRADVARHKILTVENRLKWQHRDNRDMLDDALFTALIQDKMDFVQLFIDNGVDLKRFLTFRRLRDLYDDVVMENKFPSASTDLLRNLIQHVQFRQQIGCCKRDVLVPDSPTLLKYIGRLIAYLLGDQQDVIYQGEGFEIKEDDPSKKSNTSHHYSKRHTTVRRDTTMRNHKFDFENPAKELFLWAVLLNRRQLSLFFWKIGIDHIGGALLASALLKSLSTEAERDVEMDLSNDIKEHSTQFEAHAVGVLGVCYTKEKELTHQLLTRELKTWGGTTLYSLADSAEQMEFMGHSACQTKLNKIWMGRMALYTPNWRILLCLFLPMFIPIIKFQPDEDDEKKSSYVGSVKDKRHISDVSPESSPDQYARQNMQRQHSNIYDMNSGNRMVGDETEKLVGVTCCGGCKDETGDVSWIYAVLYFYRSPIVKFSFHTLSYVVFLALFSYFVMVDLRSFDDEHWVSIAEFILWGWAVTLLCEEIRQIVTKDPNSLTYKVSGYFSSVWNQFDQFVHVMFVISIILRFTLDGQDFVYARIMYCLTLLCYFLRFLQVFFVSKNVGPKVIMIKRMLTDLLFFISILIVFILAYGVVAQALRYPNATADWVLLKDVVYAPYWQMYGELFLEDLEGDVYVDGLNDTTVSCAMDPDYPGCPEVNTVVIILFAVYMMMTNVLLLNLLIAMFSYTFERVQENSETVWRYYRYSLIYEYFDRPTLAPPLIFFNHVSRAFKYMCRRCNENEKISHDFKMVLHAEADNKLTAFERVGMESYLHNKHLLERELIDNKVQTTQDRIEKVIEDLEGIKEHMGAKPGEGLTVTTAKEPAPETSRTHINEGDFDEMRSRIHNIEAYMANQQQQLDSALQLLTQIATTGFAGGRGGVRGDIRRPSFDPLVPADATFNTMLPGTADYYGYRAPGPQIEIQDAVGPSDQSKS